MRRLKMIEISEILYRRQKGDKIKQIAKSLGYSKNTIKSVIKEAVIYKTKKKDSVACSDQIATAISKVRRNIKNQCTKETIASKLKPYESNVQMWLTQPSMTITQIGRLLLESGIGVSETSLRRYIKTYFPTITKNYTIPLVSPPGQEAQVDYGYVGMMKDSSGKTHKAYAFIMTMSFSRYRYVEYTFRQTVKSWITSHINAFKFFGGVPKTVLLDNLKSGVIKADIYDPTINRSYAEFERFYNFTIDPAKVRKPEHKGKVERSVLIVKQQLIAGRKYSNIEEANEKAKQWCAETIAKVVTKTTGKTPEALFIRERELFTPLPTESFDLAEWLIGKVHKDHHVVVKGNFYSVPTQYISKEVSIRAGFRTIKIFYDHDLIKTHVKLEGRGLWSSDINDYPEAVRKYLTQTPNECFKKASTIGEAVREVVETILEKPSKQRLRKAQAVLRLAEMYGNERVNNACNKAITFKNYEYKAIKSMLEKKIEQHEPEPVREIRSQKNSAYIRPSNYYITGMEVHYG